VHAADRFQAKGSWVEARSCGKNANNNEKLDEQLKPSSCSRRLRHTPPTAPRNLLNIVFEMRNGATAMKMRRPLSLAGSTQPGGLLSDSPLTMPLLLLSAGRSACAPPCLGANENPLAKPHKSNLEQACAARDTNLSPSRFSRMQPNFSRPRIPA